MNSEKPLDNKSQPAAFRHRRVWIVITLAVLLIFSEIALQMLKSQGWIPYTTTNSGLADTDVDAVAIDAQGRVWVGTWSGLSVLDPDGS